MSFIGALNFYTKFIEKLHINLKPFYDLLHENTPWKWTDEHESLFQKLKMSLTSETELTIPNTKHPFFITVDASLIGLGAVLFQLNEQNKKKVISYNSRILNPQEQKLSTLDRELLGIVHALQIYEFLIIGSPHPIHNFTDHKPLLPCYTKKGNLSPRFYRAQMQLTKFSKLKIIHTPGKNLSFADMLSRSFTKAELQLNQSKHKHLPPQIDFALLQDNTLEPVYYLIKHEEILPHKKHDSHPILADYGTDQFSIRINDKGNDIVVKPLQSFSFKSITPFQTKFKTPIKKNNKTLHQQSLLLNDTDVTSDDENHIYTRIPKSDSSFLQDTTLQTENYSTLKQPTHTTSQKSVSAIIVQPNLPSLTHCQQIIPFYDTSFFKYKNYFQGFFLPDDYSLDIKTLQQQQFQDPVLRTVYSWLLNNEKPEFVTPLITGTPFLQLYYKRFSQLNNNMFLHDTPKDWAFQVHMYANAHNSQPLSELNISRHEIVFHTRPRIPLTFDLNLNQDTSKTCISRNCSQLPEHSHYDKSDLNPFFYKTLSKPIPHWFLAVETAMLQIYSTVYENTLRKINSHAYITKTYHEGKPLPIGSFVLKRNFTHVHFSDKLKPLRIGPYEILDRLSDVTYELLAQDEMALQYTSTEII